MKIIITTLRLLIATAVIGMSASAAYAGPGLQHWKTLNSEAQFKELAAGSSVMHVCNTCKTISEMPIKSADHAMELCTEGGKVACPSCKQVTKVVVKTSRNQAPTHKEIRWENDKGEACVFIAVAGKK